MLVLLPPSESKDVRSRGRPMDLDSLSWPELSPQRRRVLAALEEASRRPDASALLKVSPGLVEEVARNTRLLTAPAVPAGELYTGVLYDALSLGSLGVGGRRRAGRELVVSSALHGALRLADRVSPYRLSMAARLPGLGGLAASWRPTLAPVLDAAAGDDLVVDCRSGGYAAAWTPTRPGRWVRVDVPGATHFAKHTRGRVARALCERDGRPRTPQALTALLGERFEVELVPTARGWSLRVQPEPGAPGTA